MKVKIIKEVGYNEAMIGLSLSYGTTVTKAEEVAIGLARKDGGHNKFLESIFVYLDVTAPRYWWQEADTFRISTKQSESTIHTIHKMILKQDNFELPIPMITLDYLNLLISKYKEHKTEYNLENLKNNLPEGFLQRRIWVVSYKTLRNIIIQRNNHKLSGWKMFCKVICENVENPEFLRKDE